MIRELIKLSEPRPDGRQLGKRVWLLEPLRIGGCG
jgi:hypothetical protein